LSTATLISLTIENSTFLQNIAAVDAGVIYSLYTNVNITSSIFANNNAVSGDAGVLNLYCPDDAAYLMCNYTITNSSFINNSAGVKGGAIKYNYNKPAFQGNNTFTNNKALYGNNLASYPVMLAFV
jgi:hypothetical protein